MNATPRIDPPLKWHGGKHYLAAKIVALMPPHVHYVEPFAGGLSVLLAKDPEGVSEVVNDRHKRLVNFWAVIGDPEQFDAFRRLAEATPFAEHVYRRAVELADCDTDELAPYQHAWAFFVHCRQSLAGRMKAFTALTRARTRRGMNAEASAWLSAVEGLPAVHARLRRVVILNRDALDVIRQQDGAGTLFYLDPPYHHDTRTSPAVYAHEMTAEQHAALLEELGRVTGRFLLSGYPSAMYDEAARMFGWHRVDFDVPNRATTGGAKPRRMVEAVWCNFDPKGA